MLDEAKVIGCYMLNT